MCDRTRFAFGDNTVAGTPCPVMAVTGEQPGGLLLEVAEKYDSNLRANIGKDDGVVSRETAKKAWSDATRFFREMAREETGGLREHYKATVAESEEIAEQAF